MADQPKIFDVDVKLFINVRVEAPDPDAARKVAEAWVNWLSPTMEQLLDYLSDHTAVIHDGGTFGIDGTSDVQECNP